MKFSSLIPGMVVYSVSRQKVGNTTMTTVAVHPVKIIETDSVHETVTASWNGNRPIKYWFAQYSKWRKSRPVLISGVMGRQRLATREEIAALKNQEKK